VFIPKNERFPDFGQQRIAPGSVTVEIVPPDPVRALFPPGALIGKKVSWPIEIRYHKPRGFKFEGLKLHQESGPGLGQLLAESDLTVSGGVCGDDPYATPWALKLHHTLRSRAWDSEGKLAIDETQETDMTTELELLPGVTLLPPLGQPTPLVLYTGRLALEPTPSPRLVVDATGLPEPFRPSTQTVSVPVEEDTSCPEN
jgi:hypothetical protein